MAAPVFRADLGMDPSPERVMAAIDGAVDETPADTWIVFDIGMSTLLDPAVNAESLEAYAGGRKVRLI
jgi:hypothetical protein